MVDVAVETVWSDLPPEAPLAMMPRELWPEFLARKVEVGRAALKRSLQSDLLAVCMIVCDVATQMAWQIAGKADLADWVKSELWIEPAAMADILESSKHMTYGGDRLPIDKVKTELIQGGTRKAGTPKGGRPKKGVSDTPLPKGTSSARIAARLKRDHPEIAAAVERGEYKSMRQAGLAAGIVKPPDTLKQLCWLWKTATAEQRIAFDAWRNLLQE